MKETIDCGVLMESQLAVVNQIAKFPILDVSIVSLERQVLQTKSRETALDLEDVDELVPNDVPVAISVK